MIRTILDANPGFDVSNRSDAYLQGRYDAIKGIEPATPKTQVGRSEAAQPAAAPAPDYTPEVSREARLDTATEAALAHRHRMAEAWKPAELRADAGSKTIDPDEVGRKGRERNANAWKGKSGVEMLKALEDPTADEDGVGAFGMRHGTKKREDAAAIDPDEIARRTRARLANAWRK